MILPLLQDLPGRDEARRAAERELSRRPYQEAQPPLAYRVVRYLLEKVSAAVDGLSTRVPGGGVGLLLLALLVAVVVAVVLVRVRPARTRRAPRELFGDQAALSPDGHRRLAEEAAARGDLAVAVRERLRAVVRELEQRGVLDARPGRTADEVAREAGAVVPALAEPLGRGTRVFDDVWYGGRPADRAAYDLLVDVDRTVTATRLVPA